MDVLIKNNNIDNEIDNEEYIKKKLEKFKLHNEELEISDEDSEKLIHGLINGDIKELGGLTALRGFVYQYFVAINYIIDMIHNSKAWWDAVVFELLDDIVLISDSRIRFVQVKTGKEDGKHSIKPSKLYERNNDLNSWLDTLFLNIPFFERVKKEIGFNKSIGRDFEVQFEIATNLSPDYGSYIGPYFKNDLYNLDDNDRHESDILREKLEKPLDISNPKGNKEDNVATKCLNDLLKPFDVQWCLKRLHIRSFGYFSEIEKKINFKIMSILNDTNEILVPSISNYIVKRLLSYLVMRTHKDGPNLNKEELVFKKQEMIHLFNQWKKEAKILLFDASYRDNLIAEFNKCLVELKNEVMTKWHGEAKDEIINTLNWISSQLWERVNSKRDINAYERFLNKLFEVKNDIIHFSLEETNVRKYLMNSLEYIAMCLSFYSSKDYPYENANLLFKQGKEELGDIATFVTYNAREQLEYDYAQRKLVQSSKTCSETNRIKEDYYCIIIDAKESLKEDSDPFAAFNPITSAQEQRKITDVPTNMHFIDQEKLSKFMTAFQRHSNEQNFKSSKAREIWRDILGNSKLGGKEN
jgi:Cap4 dsDNA endonuclease